jgi:predicted DNA-binding WGR domain protein
MTNVKLGYTDRFSDKVYIMSLDKVDNGWRVNVRYGKRSNINMKAQYPVSGPTDDGDARKIFDQQLKKKLAKGYIIESYS